MKYRFIANHRDTHSVEKMARTLRVSRSGYYAWFEKPRSKCDRRDEMLVEAISSVQEDSKRRYGSPRVTRELRRRGHRVGHNHVARLMKENGLQARRRRRYRSTTNSDHTLPVAQNLLNRQFGITEPNVAWVSDITYVATAEGWLYLCVIMDVASRKIVGWSLDRRMAAQLVIDAFMMAIIHCGPVWLARCCIWSNDPIVENVPGYGSHQILGAGCRHVAILRHIHQSGNVPSFSRYSYVPSTTHRLTIVSSSTGYQSGSPTGGTMVQ